MHQTQRPVRSAVVAPPVEPPPVAWSSPPPAGSSEDAGRCENSIFDHFGRITIAAGLCLIAGLLVCDWRAASMRFFAASPSPIEARAVSSHHPVIVDMSSQRADLVDQDVNVDLVAPDVVLPVFENTEQQAGPVLNRAEYEPVEQVESSPNASEAETLSAAEIARQDWDAYTAEFGLEKSRDAVHASDDQTASNVEPAKTRTAKKELPASISALSMVKSQASIMPATCEDGTCAKPGKTLGTSLQWAETPADAYRKAGEDDKLVFLIHVSGNFEIPGFT